MVTRTPLNVTQCQHRVSSRVTGISTNIRRYTMHIYQHYQPDYIRNVSIQLFLKEGSDVTRPYLLTNRT